MPYKIVKKGKIYKLYNIKKKKFINSNFKSKATAGNQAINYMRYTNEKGKIVGMNVVNI